MAKDGLDQLARRLAESLPQSVRALGADIEQNFRSILGSGLARLDLVTREEFDVQEAVLARTRAKLDALEQRLAELETAAAPAKPPARKTTAKPSAKQSTKKKTAKKTGKKTASKATGKKPATRKKRPATRD